VTFRKDVAALAPVGSATVDAEALFVRLAYMALRRENRLTDAAAINQVLATLGSSSSVKYALEYVCPGAYDSTLTLRRKD